VQRAASSRSALNVNQGKRDAAETARDPALAKLWAHRAVRRKRIREDLSHRVRDLTVQSPASGLSFDSPSLVRSFRLTNTSPDEPRAFVLQASPPGLFTVSPSSGIIAAQQSATLTVRFTPRLGDPAVQSTRVTGFIRVRDRCGFAGARLALVGFTPPFISLPASRIALGDSPVGHANAFNIPIRAVGLIAMSCEARIEILSQPAAAAASVAAQRRPAQHPSALAPSATAADSSSPFVLTPPSLALLPHSTAILRIVFRPRVAGVYRARVTITSAEGYELAGRGAEDGRLEVRQRQRKANQSGNPGSAKPGGGGPSAATPELRFGSSWASSLVIEATAGRNTGLSGDVRVEFGPCDDPGTAAQRRSAAGRSQARRSVTRAFVPSTGAVVVSERGAGPGRVFVRLSTTAVPRGVLRETVEILAPGVRRALMDVRAFVGPLVKLACARVAIVAGGVGGSGSGGGGGGGTADPTVVGIVPFPPVRPGEVAIVSVPVRNVSPFRATFTISTLRRYPMCITELTSAEAAPPTFFKPDRTGRIPRLEIVDGQRDGPIEYHVTEVEGFMGGGGGGGGGESTVGARRRSSALAGDSTARGSAGGKDAVTTRVSYTLQPGTVAHLHIRFRTAEVGAYSIPLRVKAKRPYIVAAEPYRLVAVCYSGGGSNSSAAGEARHADSGGSSAGSGVRATGSSSGSLPSPAALPPALTSALERMLPVLERPETVGATPKVHPDDVRHSAPTQRLTNDCELAMVAPRVLQCFRTPATAGAAAGGSAGGAGGAGDSLEEAPRPNSVRIRNVTSADTQYRIAVSWPFVVVGRDRGTLKAGGAVTVDVHCRPGASAPAGGAQQRATVTAGGVHRVRGSKEAERIAQAQASVLLG
jgi:hypothetical protein